MMSATATSHWLADYWESVFSFLPGFLGASVIAVEVALVTILISWVFGLIGVLAKSSRYWIVRAPADFYVWFMRGTPQLIQVFIIYFGMPQLGLNLPPFIAGSIALGIGSGAYVTEVFRSGLSAIPKGQRESALAIGMSGSLTMRRIIFPQMIRIIVPALTNEAISTLKNTSLLSTITIMELTLYTQTVIAATFRPFDFYIIAALLYLTATTLLTQFATWYERRYALYI